MKTRIKTYKAPDDFFKAMKFVFDLGRRAKREMNFEVQADAEDIVGNMVYCYRCYMVLNLKNVEVN